MSKEKLIEVLSELEEEVVGVMEQLDELEKSNNPEVAGVVKLSKQFTNSWFWVIEAEGKSALWMDTEFRKHLIENGMELLTALRESREQFDQAETKALLTRLGFYKP